MSSKYVHLCWFGPKPIPENYRKNLQRWILLSAESQWAVCLWDNDSLDTWPRKNQLSENLHPAQVCDIFRLDVLHEFGGLYADIDIIPLRLPEIYDEDTVHLFTENDCTGSTCYTNAVMYAPAYNPKIAEMRDFCISNVTDDPNRTIEQHLKASASMFKYFPASFFEGTTRRGINHYSPVSWAHARALNLREEYTYDDWLTLAESFLPHDEVYGVHTYDSTWVHDLNNNRPGGDDEQPEQQ